MCALYESLFVTQNMCDFKKFFRRLHAMTANHISIVDERHSGMRPTVHTVIYLFVLAVDLGLITFGVTK